VRSTSSVSLRDSARALRRSVRSLWCAAVLERGRVSTVRSFGAPVRFLVDDPGDHIQWHHAQGIFYAEDELKLIREFYRGGAFVDVGANVGNHSLFAERILGARVIAIEPVPEACKVLRCNIALNDSDIRHLPFGLSDRPGRASYSSPAGNLGGTALTEDPTGPIELRVGDDLIEDIGFLKVDAEFMELEVLRGLRNTITRQRPDLIVEVSDPNISGFQRLVSEWGYEVRRAFKPFPAFTCFVARPRPA
jgi:FkbM family methyltransferase